MRRIRSLCAAGALAVTAAAQAGAPHWSYRAVVRPELPENAAWCREPLDRFVLAAMRQKGLSPAPALDRVMWLRRAALDLTGLPPSAQAVAQLVADPGDDDAAKGRAVDRLFAQPAYGERWALWWLDFARYADSQGYEKDALRPSMWRWRDWVVAAFQSDMPFDRFTIEQLAGDLLPEPTVEQRIATAFHRQTMTNTEGGTDDEEFRTAAVIDRTNTTMSVWMASTVGCAQCHDHKYDPFSQKEYYGLYAFFDQTADRDRDDEEPTLAAPTEGQRARAAAIDAEIAALAAQIDGAAVERLAFVRAARDRVLAWAAAAPTASDWRVLGPVTGADYATAFAAEFAPERGVEPDGEQEGLRWQVRADYVDGKVHEWRGDASATYLLRTITLARPARATLVLGSDDGIKVWCNGELRLAVQTKRGAEPGQEHVEVELRAGANEILLKVVNGDGPGGFCYECAPTELGRDAEAELADAADEAVLARVAEGSSVLRAAFAERSGAVRNQRTRIAALRREREAVAGPRVPVLEELPQDRRRTTRLFLRGSFLSPGEVVTPDVPACWPPLPAGAPHDRLALARWLVARANPLTARVQVNRIWEQLFGRGLVASSEDFGRQGEPPTHAALLDWLASDFVDEGWSLHRLLRHLVLSATYAQSVAAPAEVRALDPDNRWLARGAAFRLPGELLRDRALAVSGLLSARRGGPSVMPQQPEGVWGQIYSGEKWRTSEGEDRHRRSLYTLWRRTSPHPAMTTFDAPSREFCVVRRVRTNTPLQTLVTWNDPQFVECAEALARRLLADRDAADGPAATADARDRDLVQRMFRACLQRAADAAEAARLVAFVRSERAALGADGRAEADVEQAAWTRCAAVVLNLDEFVTRG